MSIQNNHFPETSSGDHTHLLRKNPGPQKLFLFDIDGVLVEPLGYRAAVQSSLDLFTSQMGLGAGFYNSKEIIPIFEAHRITSEWDMVPLCLSRLFDRYQALHPDPPFTAGLDAALAFLHTRLLSDQEIHSLQKGLNMPEFIRSIESILIPGRYPSESAFAARESLFPAIGESSLLAQLLQNTRQVSLSTTTRIFQNFSLGSERFSGTYGLPPEFETDSLLLRYDRPLLPAALRKTLVEQRAGKQIGIAAYTMRPSLPPRPIRAKRNGYAPEAELALQLVGLLEVPLIGYGRIRYLAEKQHVEPETYLKPSPVQGLAAILSAYFEDELFALQAAATLTTDEDISGLWGNLIPRDNLCVHVFEDSPGGVEAVWNAVRILEERGFRVRVRSWGIAAHPEKVAALQKLKVPVLPTLEEAVRQALQEQE